MGRAKAQRPQVRGTGGAVVYTRVSSAEQVDGTSLDTQRQICEQCAARLGLPVLAVLTDEGKSAKTTRGRDALAAALAVCEERRATLIVYKFDRLARNVGDAYQMREILLAKGCRIVSATEGEAAASPMAKALFNMMATFAELDNDMRAERSATGMRARSLAGCYVTHPPYGMVAVRGKAGEPLLAPDPLTGPFVRETILAIVAGTMTQTRAIEAFRARGVCRSQAYNILRHPAYGGIIQNKFTDGREVRAAFDGLVTPDEWHQLQTIIGAEGAAAKEPRMYRRNNPDFPFSRLIKCPVCGGPLTGGWSKGGNGDRYGHYFCPRAGHCSMTRDHVHVQMDALAVRLSECGDYIRFLRENIHKADLRNDPVEAQQVENARQSLAKDEARLARVRSAFLDGDLTPEEYRAERARTEAAIDEARTILRTHDEMSGRRDAALDALCDVVAGGHGLFDRLTASQTRDFVRVVFGELEVVGSAKTFEPSQESLFQLLVKAQGTEVRNGGGEWI